MLKLLRNKKAQNTAEYALMIAIVVGAFSIMQLYIKRGLQARIKSGVDNIPGAVITGADADDTLSLTQNLFVDGRNGGNYTYQYEPYYYREGTSNMTTLSDEGTETGTIESTTSGASGVRNLTGADSTRTGSQQVLGQRNE
ncbi:MAG: hypothetical protein Q7J72_03940 [Candidatus Omnitrophota bacterium]|nr:hypothetical protein [Candidatus Omnitrophota bacterium]